MGRSLVETIIGGVVLSVAVLFLVFAYRTADIGAVDGYELMARFDRVDGLQSGSDVRVSGIKVGTIVGQTLDPQTFLAVVRMSIEDSVKLPVDTTAEVLSDGLLGSKYLALVPGGEDKNIEPGGEVKYTQGPVSLESLIGRLIFSAGDKKKEDAGAKPAQ